MGIVPLIDTQPDALQPLQVAFVRGVLVEEHLLTKWDQLPLVAPSKHHFIGCAALVADMEPVVEEGAVLE